MDVTSFNQIAVDSPALEQNFRYIQGLAGDSTAVLAMVKANAYGHGSIEAARAFTRAGCSIFGVAELREAVILREAGVSGQIYVVIGFDLNDVGYFFQYDLTPVIYSIDAASALSAMAISLNTTIDVHIKIDTGMGRLGFVPADVPAVFEKVETLPGLRLAGIMSHFPEADDPQSQTTPNGLESFSGLCSIFKSRVAGVCHIANSAAVLNFPSASQDMVRAGIALYGYHPAGRNADNSLGGDYLKPAMSFSSKVLQVKEVPPGTGISYGHTYTTKTESKIAVLPVGYEDGYSRSLSNKGEVLIRGQRAIVRGRICMNMCMVDVTEIDGVVAGDEVVLHGSQGALTINADDIAEKMDSISYEVLCMLGHNNNRNYQVG